MKYLFLFFICFADMAYGQYSLSLRLEKGSNYFLKVNSSNHFNGEIDGKKMDLLALMSGAMKFTVLGVTNLGYELGASYDTVHLTIKGPMGQMEFSAGKGLQESDPVAGPLSPFLGRQIHITLLKNGAVSGISNPDTTGFSGMLAHFPMANMLKQMITGSFKNSFNRETIKEHLEKLTAIFPDKTVALGESWGSVIKPDSGSDNSIKTSYRLVSYESGAAVIKGHSESKAIFTQKNNGEGPGFHMPGEGELTGESESTITVNASTGWIREASIKNELKGHIQIKNKPGAAVQVTPLAFSGELTLSGY